jgi:NAD-dependent deacetylase sirtuin 3
VKSTQELTALNRPMERTLFSRASSKSASSINTVNSRKASATSGIYNLDCLINDIINRKFKKVLVLTGAGISTPSGIPDFRTPGTGIYDNLEKFKVPYPEAIFEKEYFRRNPRPFFKIAKDLLPNKKQYKPNKIHYFIRLLQEKKILHRLYTQNIDNLETLAGIRPDKLVEAHGSFKSAKCTKCSNEYPAEYAEV